MKSYGGPGPGSRDEGMAHRWPHFATSSAVGLLSVAALVLMGADLFPEHRAALAGVLAGALLVCLVFLLKRATGTNAPRLTAAEKTYRAFFDHAIEGIFRTTPEGRYIAANPALAKIYGYDSPALLMVSLTDIAGQLYVAPGRREEFGDLLRANDVVTDFVSEIRRRDGSTIWISEKARAVRDWTGRLVFYEGTVEDVTAKIESDKAIRDALQEAEESNRVKSAFLAVMSHELKTPLNAVLGFSEILMAEMLGPLGQDGYRDYAVHIHESGVRLLEIINNVLDLTRLQSGALTLERAPLSVAELAADAIVRARAAAGTAQDVTLDVTPDPPAINADPERLRQVLFHLLSNALKFTPAGGAVSVRVRTADAGGLSVSVVDSGIGMAPNQIAAALEPFHQIDGSLARRFGGTGLGLAISKALVELHGGQLTIESREGEGTAVTVWLPAALSMARSAA